MDGGSERGSKGSGFSTSIGSWFLIMLFPESIGNEESDTDEENEEVDESNEDVLMVDDGEDSEKGHIEESDVEEEGEEFQESDECDLTPVEDEEMDDLVVWDIRGSSTHLFWFFSMKHVGYLKGVWKFLRRKWNILECWKLWKHNDVMILF